MDPKETGGERRFLAGLEIILMNGPTVTEEQIQEMLDSIPLDPKIDNIPEPADYNLEFVWLSEEVDDQTFADEPGPCPNMAGLLQAYKSEMRQKGVQVDELQYQELQQWLVNKGVVIMDAAPKPYCQSFTTDNITDINNLINDYAQEGYVLHTFTTHPARIEKVVGAHSDYLSAEYSVLYVAVMILDAPDQEVIDAIYEAAGLIQQDIRQQ